MNYEWLKNELSSIERRLKIFLARYTELQQQLQYTQKENTELQQQIISQKNIIDSLQNTVQFTKLAEALQKNPTQLKETQKTDPLSTQTLKLNEPAHKTSQTQKDTDPTQAYVKLLDSHITQLGKYITYLEK